MTEASQPIKEHLDWLYHCRMMQMIALVNQTSQVVAEDMQQRADIVRATTELMQTPKVVLDLKFQRNEGLRQEFFENAAQGAVVIAKRDLTTGVLVELTHAVHESNRTHKEVPIDDSFARINPGFVFAFAEKPELLTDAINQGAEEARRTVLSAMQGETPLLRLPRRLAQGKINFIPSLDGGEIGYLPTKIPGVDLKYYYPQGQQLPKLSFYVREL